MAGRRRIGWLLPALALLALPLTDATAASTAPDKCGAIGMSPSFHSDGTAFCAVMLDAGPVLWRTTDRGRSWTKFALSPGVLPTQTRAVLYQLTVSPRYAVDSAVYLHTNSGIYITTNPAEGLRPVDPLATANDVGIRNMAGYVDASAGLVSQGERVIFAYAALNAASRIDPPLHSRVPAAAPHQALQFLTPPRVSLDRTPILVGRHLNYSAQGDNRVATYECTIALTCATEMHVFPSGEFAGAWLSPAFDKDGIVYVAMSTGKRYSMFRSVNRGRTFAPWTAVDKVLAPINAEMASGDGDTHFPPTLAIDQSNPRTMFLRMSQQLSTSRIPAQQLFRSTDGGATWSRIGFAWGDARRATLPWDGPGLMQAVRAADNDVMAVGGRVFAVGTSIRDGYSGVFCSVDSGRTWSRACSR